MTKIKIENYTGYSNTGISEAIKNALEKAGDHARFEIIETRGSRTGEESNYQVTLATFSE